MKQVARSILIFIFFYPIFILLYPNMGYTMIKSVVENRTLSTVGDRTSLVLTIYNQNYGLVREERTLSLLPAEKQEIWFMDVPAQIEPDTVLVEVEKQGIKILEEKFEYDLITRENLLKYYVGQQVKILEKNPATGEKNTVEAELVSFNNNQPIYRIKGEIYLGYPDGVVILSGIPEQMVTRPTLRWLLEKTDRSARKKSAAVSYLSRGLNWTANYVLQLNPDGTEGDLFSWVAIENQSGAAFQDAKIKLVAGEVRRKEEEVGYRRMRMVKSFDAESAPAPFKEEAFAEYHLYTLSQTATLKDQQTTRISFIEASQIPVQKKFIFLGEGAYQRNRQQVMETPKPVTVYIELENKKKQHLGLPLPQGSIKVYQRDSEANLEFIGEDRLRHTPEGETIHIQIGSAFDVVGVQKQMEWQKIGDQIYESNWQVNLRNQKSEKVVVQVIEPVQGEWKVLSSSHPYERLEAYKIGFSVPVPAKGEETLTYRIQVKF